jgi:dTDP-4-amino-4,6-dideoxygalactose transaminase
MMRIPLSKPPFTEEMKEAAIDALQNEFFVMGESVYKFEEEFARYVGTKYAVAVNSGTFALASSLIASGIEKGDKILTTPMSFIATANSVIHADGIPVFSDIESDTGNIDTTLIENMIKDIKGIVPVHLYGNPCDMDKIKELKKEGIFVIEDACQAHGAEYKGKKAGSIGDVGCFSFYSVKNMTVGGDGGMATTNNEEIAEKIRILRDCGRVSKYEHSVIGYTARLNTVNAAIGRVQLKHLDEWNEKRKYAARIYQKNLPEELLLGKNGNSVYHIFAIRSKRRDEIIRHLKENGIGTGIHYPIPIHLQPIYKKLFGYKEGDYPVSERFGREILSLPMYPEITKDEVEFVCEKVMGVIG